MRKKPKVKSKLFEAIALLVEDIIEDKRNSMCTQMMVQG